MDKETRRSEVDDILGTSDLMTLVELQKFLADELSGSTDGTEDFSRAFLPLTDGLGLENPPKREVPQARTQPVPETKLDPTEIFPDENTLPVEKKPASQLDSLFDGPQSRAAGNGERTAAETPRETVAPIFAEPEVQVPPPMPQASFLRRLLAGVADVCFVLMLWGITLAITAIAMGGSAEGLLAHLPKYFANGAFVRNALTAYAAIWFGYFLVTVGFANATVGMWAWGMRTAPVDDDARLLKKMVRAALSFLVMAPLAPTLLLLARSKGRNLIDGLTGTHVYRTGQ